MGPVELKVARIGNSRGVRIPATTLERYQIGESVLMEERSEGILLRPRSSAGVKLSWDDTACEMAAAAEDWSAWEAAVADGLEGTPWESRKSRSVAELRARYAPRRRRRK